MRYIKIREGVIFISNLKQSLEEHKLNIKTRSEGNRENNKKIEWSKKQKTEEEIDEFEIKKPIKYPNKVKG